MTRPRRGDEGEGAGRVARLDDITRAHPEGSAGPYRAGGVVAAAADVVRRLTAATP